MKVAVIIPAAGSGKRMGGVKKQFLRMGGVPVLAHTIMQFERFHQIDAIFVVIPKGDISRFHTEVLEPFVFKKVQEVVEGGEERQDSVANALKRTSGFEVIMVHDGVRPFVTPEIIANSIKSVVEFGATVTAVPEKDTVKSIDADGFVVETLNRDLLWRIQTPQTFKRDVLVEALKKADNDGIRGTDESSLVEKAGFKVKVIQGSYHNIKITTQEDLDWCPVIMDKLVQVGWKKTCLGDRGQGTGDRLRGA